jgi:uncharacterized protein YigE (DUF2233 family)
VYHAADRRRPRGGVRVSAVVESSAYPALDVKPDLAIQSGPLLVSGNRIHPAFNPAGMSKYVRNGVGVRDGLRCPDALYLDGAISQFYVAPATPDTTGRFAGIIAVTKPL